MVAHPQVLANNTKCTVIAPNGYINTGSEPWQISNPKTFPKIKIKDKEKGEEDYTKETDDNHASENDKVSVYEPGGERKVENFSKVPDMIK